MNKIIHTLLVVFLFVITQPSLAQLTPKIIGGSIAHSTAWPWMTGLATKGKSDFQGQFCGASLIASSWVLTAAHCIIDESTHNIDVIINQAKFDTGTGERIAVDKFFIHPLYNNDSLDNDIALIKLQQPSEIKPIKTISRDSILDTAGHDALTLGWGKTSATEKIYPDVLYQVGLPIMTDARCSSKLPGFTNNMLCAGAGAGQKDTCQGDSGGPLIVFNEKTHDWNQVGITSWGNGCSKKGFSGVYTRLKNYDSFLSETICSPIETPPTVTLKLTTQAHRVTASWSKSKNTTGYRLYYAPFPQAEPIQYADMGDTTQFSADLVPGSAYYVAITSYNNSCHSSYSNIEHFIIQ